ncbi:hypothetical protein Gotur_035513 [Gossypium turneri]
MGSVLSLWKTCSYNWDYWWMDPYSPGLFNETHSRSWRMIQLK